MRKERRPRELIVRSVMSNSSGAGGSARRGLCSTLSVIASRGNSSRLAANQVSSGLQVQNRGKIMLLLLLFLCLCAAGAAADEEVTNDACLACHGMEGFAGEEGQPLFVNGEAFGASIHGTLPCTGCHPDATTIPHEEKPAHAGAQACATCHPDIVETYETSIHGKARANGENDAATCTSCHGPPHTLRKVSDPGSPVYALNLPRTCGTCHGDEALAKRHSIPVVDAYQLYMDSIHGRALTRSGLLVAANCSSCHGSHGILPPTNPKSKVYRTTIPNTCGTCHAGVKEEYFKGIHGQALEEGHLKAPVCVDCHSAHQIARVDTTPWKLQAIRECGTCHEESLKTYRDTFHGQVTSLGFTIVARCSDCHGAHLVLPASNPGSTIAPANLVTTCRKCHPDANANFVLFSPHADPEDPKRNPGLYYVAQGMTWLIIGTFFFFGLHTVLWLVRSLVEHRNGERTE